MSYSIMRDGDQLIEKCFEQVTDGFHLVILAAQRAKELSAGIAPLIDRENHKDALLALREIACSAVDVKSLTKRSVAAYQKYSFLEEDQS